MMSRRRSEASKVLVQASTHDIEWGRSNKNRCFVEKEFIFNCNHPPESLDSSVTKFLIYKYYNNI